MFSTDFLVSVIAEHNQQELEAEARQARLVKIARERKKQLRRLAQNSPDKHQTPPTNKRG